MVVDAKVCPNCNGSKLGVISAFGDQKACGNCNGSGRVPVEQCPDCLHPLHAGECPEFVDVYYGEADVANSEPCGCCTSMGKVMTSPAVRQPPYPWCRGNPTKQDCIDAGYCKRDPNCGE